MSLSSLGSSAEAPPLGTGSGSLSAQTTTLPPASVLPKDARSLVSMLSKVDMTPGDLLNALAKAHGQGSGVQGEMLALVVSLRLYEEYLLLTAHLTDLIEVLFK